MQAGKKFLDKIALLLMCAGNMATGVEKNDMTVGIPVSSGGISALCRMLCPAAFKQKSIKMKVADAWKAEDFQ